MGYCDVIVEVEMLDTAIDDLEVTWNIYEMLFV